MIEAIGVVIPAHDEEQTIGRCLRALATSLAGVRQRVEVCVVADRCTDATVSITRKVMPTATVLVVEAARSLGEVRDLGVREVLDRLAGHDPAAVWLMGTDADTRVSAAWVGNQLAHADTVDAVTGLIALEPAEHLNAVLRDRYQQLVAAGIRPLDHDHVHGANFGVRASAFLAVGGYRPLRTGEDRDLWYRLREAGFSTRQPRDLTVATSSRLVGRATDGLADLLSGLVSPDQVGPPRPGYRGAANPAC